MTANIRDIPGYIVLAGVAVLALLLFGASEIITHHKTAFEKETGYKDIDALISAKIAFQEQVERKITEMSGKGDDAKQAKDGDPAAQYRLGIFYLYDDNDKMADRGFAYTWLRKAADQKYAKAEYQVGRMYANGLVGDGDMKKSITWYQRAAEDGYPWAQINLGEIYLHFLAKEFGAEQDFSKAYFWLSVGTAGEDPMSDFIRDRDAAGAHLKDADKAAIDSRIRDWSMSHPALAEKPSGK